MTFDKTKVLERLFLAEPTNLFFLKLSGEEREMKATLNPDFLTQKLGSPDSMQDATIDDLITVWDIEADGWRAFYLQNLVTIDGVEPEEA